MKLLTKQISLIFCVFIETKHIPSDFENKLRAIGFDQFLEIPSVGFSGGLYLCWNTSNLNISVIDR